MTSGDWAIIIAALIGAIGGILASNFDRVIDFWQKPTRRLEGVWEGTQYNYEKIVRSPDGNSMPDNKQRIVFKQIGSRVKGKMTFLDRSPDEHIWRGKIISNDFLLYECIPTNKSRFQPSTGLLHLSGSGKELAGYFVATSGGKHPSEWVGFVELEKIE